MADNTEGQNVTTTNKRKRRRWPWVVGVLVAFLVWNYWPVESKLTISPETTVITGPLNPDGTVNYFQALVNRASEGVTPENNAAVLLVRALGPGVFCEEVRDESLKQLGLTEERLAKDEPYLELYARFQRRHLSAKDADLPDSQELLAKLMRRPWTAKDAPLVAAWLEANERPLKLVAEASHRERLYLPRITLDDPPVMLTVLIPNLLQIRMAAEALAARAMLRLGSGNIHRANEDLLAVRRLGRLLTDAHSLIEMLVGIALDGAAGTIERAMIDSDKLTSTDIRLMLTDIQALGAMPTLTHTLEVERFRVQEMVMLARRKGINSANFESPSPGEHAARTSSSFDGDVALTIINYWWDRLMAAETAASFPEHRKKIQEFERAFSNAVAEWGNTAAKLSLSSWGGRVLKRPRGRYLARALTFMCLTNPGGARGLWERANAENEVITLALAARLCKLETGQWPADLAALVPEYLEAVPADRFTGEPLRYVRGEDGSVTIYSHGPNMIDDGGLNFYDAGDDDSDIDGISEDADDIAITLR
ncbi:MAG: hypothetical protein ACYS8X_03430 [Planctomycetota bacterium]